MKLLRLAAKVTLLGQAVVVWQDASAQVWLGYNDPSFLARGSWPNATARRPARRSRACARPFLDWPKRLPRAEAGRGSMQSSAQACPPWRHIAAAIAVSCGLGGCATPEPPTIEAAVRLPLLQGWFDNEAVFYVTTDVSDAQVAKDKQANFAPRLADALPRGPQRPGQASSVDKVYAVTNFKQASIFASAPQPMGHLNRDPAYSPLWRMVTVTWEAGRAPRVLTSEEQVLAAAEAGSVRIETTDVVLNCPIVHRGAKGGLPGVSLPGGATAVR